MPLMQMVLSATIPSTALSDVEDILQLWASGSIDLTLIMQGELTEETLRALRHLLARLAERPEAHVLPPLVRELFIKRPQEPRP